MTREEAIFILKEDVKNACWPMYQDALDMAISALSAEPSDLISRADAMGAVKETLSGNVYWDYVCDALKALKALPSAEAVQGFRGGKIPPKEMLNGTVLIPQHQWIEMERELAELKEKFESADRPNDAIDHDKEWIIGCIKHDGFIHTHRFDKANRIILEALQTDVVRCKDCRYRYEEGDCTHYYWCRLNDRPIDDDNFCSWAKMKGGAE